MTMKVAMLKPILSSMEIDDYKDEGSGHLLGGGTYYEFGLASLAQESVAEAPK